MALHYSPERESILKEVKPWRLDLPPPVLTLDNNSPKYAVILIMAGDDATLGSEVPEEIEEIADGVRGGDEVSVLVLADMAKPRRQTVYFEISDAGSTIIKKVQSIDTGDPRPIAAFITAALNSFPPETRIAIGLWGHGEGVIGDLDPTENLVPDELRLLPLGTPFTEADFIKHGILSADPIKPFLFKSMLPDMETGNVLTNRELSSALTVAFSRCRRTEPVDLIFFDTCYNGAAEVYAEVRRYAHTFVASSLRLPKTGWDYQDFLKNTRTKLPETPQDWARLAIHSCNHAYRAYQTPVHMVALNCQTQALKRLHGVVDRIQQIPRSTAQNLLRQASKDLKAVGRNESLDLFHVVNSIRQATEDDQLYERCQHFLQAYNDTVIASSAPPSDGRLYTGLTVWFPRLGDTHQVHRYYERLQFNRETNWVSLIEHLIRRQKRDPSVFLVYCFQGLKLLEEHPVTDLILDTSVVRDTNLLLKISETSKPWTTHYKEGRYSYQKVSSITFPSSQDFRDFTEALVDIQRHDEFAAFHVAQETAITMDSGQAKKLGRALWKYKNIVEDEFPLLLGSYQALEEIVAEASKGYSVIVIGQGSRLHKPEPSLETLIRSSELSTRFTLDLAMKAPRGFKLPFDSLRYYPGPIDIPELIESSRHPNLGITDMLGVFAEVDPEQPLHAQIVKYTQDNQHQDCYFVVLQLADADPAKPGIFHFDWTEWSKCPKCQSPHPDKEPCSCS